MRQGAQGNGQAVAAVFDLGEGRKLAGQITLRRGKLFESTAKLCDDEFFSVPDGSALQGVSEKGKVSLLGCSRGHPRSTWHGDVTIFRSDVSFAYALFGNQHLTLADTVIKGIQFTFEEIDAILTNTGFDTFGHIDRPDDELIDVIERKRPDFQKGDLSRDGSAMVSYFTGKFNVLPKTETALGTIRTSRALYTDAVGREMKDKPYVTIDFDDQPATLDVAFGKMRAVRQFFAWIIGYAPRWEDVRVFTSNRVEAGCRVDDSGHPDRGLEVFSPIEWRSAYYDNDNNFQGDATIDASLEPDRFADVMKKWLERDVDAKRRSANARFFGSMPGMVKKTVEDGICAAANTFDLLPTSDKPRSPLIAKETKNVLAEAGRRIRKLENVSDAERQEVLSQLGRIRAYVSLRQVIESKAKIVLERVGEERLPNMDKVIRAAVLCRNHFTHGSGDGGANDVDFSDPSTVLFLTRTLQFIYGASELLTCGWDLVNWLNGTRTYHPFGWYIHGYQTQLTRTGLC